MIKALSVEFYKIRHKKVGLTIAMMIVVQFMWNLWAMRNMDIHELSQGWMRCLCSFSQMNCIMMPIIVGVIASRLSDIEHKGKTMKLLKTIISDNKIFVAKFLCGTFYMLIAVILQVGIIVFIGKIRGLIGEIPVKYICYYAMFTLLINLTLLLLQLMFSLIFINQMVGFIVAITGAFLSLYSLFFSNAIARLILWSYYSVLLPVGMDWDKGTRIVDFYWIDIPKKEFLILIIVFILLYVIGKKLFTMREV